MFKVKLNWSKSSRLLQRIALSCFQWFFNILWLRRKFWTSYGSGVSELNFEKSFLLNPFHATGLFRHPLFSCHWSLSIPPVFRGYRKRPVAWNELMNTRQDRYQSRKTYLSIQINIKRSVLCVTFSNIHVHIMLHVSNVSG